MTYKLFQTCCLLLPVLLAGCGMVKRESSGETPWAQNGPSTWLQPGENAADESHDRRSDVRRGPASSDPAAASNDLDRSIEDSILTLIDNTDDPELRRMLVGNMHAFYGNRTPEKLQQAIAENDQERAANEADDSPQAALRTNRAPVGTGTKSNAEVTSQAGYDAAASPHQFDSPSNSNAATDSRHAIRAEQERQQAEQMISDIQGSLTGMTQRQLADSPRTNGLANPSTNANLQLNSQLLAQQRFTDSSIAPSRSDISAAQPIQPVGPTDSAAKSEERIPVGRWKTQILQTIATLEASRQQPERTLTHQERINSELTLRFLYMLTADREKALLPIEGLSETENAYWKEQLFAMSELVSLTNVDLESSLFTSNTHRNAIAVQHERAALGHLADSAMLQVRNLNLCRSIDGFGSFETFPSMTFEKNQNVLVYCELENLSARETVGAKYQQFESEYRGTVTIQNADRKVVSQTTYETGRDVCRNRRLDFFVYFLWQIPSDLPTGDYYLQVTVEDQLGGKTSSSPAPLAFRIR